MKTNYGRWKWRCEAQKQPLSLISKKHFTKLNLSEIVCNNKSIVYWSASMCIVHPSNSKAHLPSNKHFWPTTQNEKDTVFLKNKGLSNLCRKKYRLFTGAPTYICYLRQSGRQTDRKRVEHLYGGKPAWHCQSRDVVWHRVMWQWTVQLNRKTNILLVITPQAKTT